MLGFFADEWTALRELVDRSHPSLVDPSTPRPLKWGLYTSVENYILCSENPKSNERMCDVSMIGYDATGQRGTGSFGWTHSSTFELDRQNPPETSPATRPKPGWG